MKNILILADGSVGRRFVEWVGRKRVAENRYYIVCSDPTESNEKAGKNVTYFQADPTSFVRIKHIMQDIEFSQVFIVMYEQEDARYALSNVRLLDEKILIVFADLWGEEGLTEEDANTVVLDSVEILATHLYGYLPNVPLVAQNVGLGKGEIMEILVPFGSTYAYRHVGSILQRKWHIAAIYRNEKLILPTNATMIRPNDTILAVGKPLVLQGVYRTVNRRIGQFPEPFGQHLLLIIDFQYDKKHVRRYIDEVEYVASRLDTKKLFIRILEPDDFSLVEHIKSLESHRIDVAVNYTQEDLAAYIEYEIQENDVGWVFCSPETFRKDTLCRVLYDIRKIVTVFGDVTLDTLEKSIVLMDTPETMESISSAAFDAAVSLSHELCLCDFDPEGKFEFHRIVSEHYETLSQIFDKPIHIEKKVANPVRASLSMGRVMEIIPFKIEACRASWKDFWLTRVFPFLLHSRKHPKLFVPVSSERFEESKSGERSCL